MGKGKKDSGYLYKALMVAHVLFPVLTCGGVSLQETSGSPSFRVICRGAIHCAHRQCIGLGWGRNELRPYTISYRFTQKDIDPDKQNPCLNV